MVRLLRRFNNIEFQHDLTSRPEFATGLLATNPNICHVPRDTFYKLIKVVLHCSVDKY
jgi:hypothetical protein